MEAALKGFGGFKPSLFGSAASVASSSSSFKNPTICGGGESSPYPCGSSSSLVLRTSAIDRTDSQTQTDVAERFELKRIVVDESVKDKYMAVVFVACIKPMLFKLRDDRAGTPSAAGDYGTVDAVVKTVESVASNACTATIADDHQIGVHALLRYTDAADLKRKVRSSTGLTVSADVAVAHTKLLYALIDETVMTRTDIFSFLYAETVAAKNRSLFYAVKLVDAIGGVGCNANAFYPWTEEDDGTQSFAMALSRFVAYEDKPMDALFATMETNADRRVNRLTLSFLCDMVAASYGTPFFAGAEWEKINGFEEARYLSKKLMTPTA